MKLTKALSAISFALSCAHFSSNAALTDTSQDWQTFETENFRVHYTPEYRQWALSSAREMEQVRRLIKAQQGRVLTEKVDAYIIDPYNAANGFAMPLSHRPYMALFATPPLSDTVIANSTGWQQLLVLHEYVHLVHLAQKTRSPWRNTLANWYDIYDAAQIKGERWVAEGYATLLESKLTGRGRLYNNQVEAIIQQFARQGALPTYQQLSEINDNFMSGSMAYLVGVRYLKWLEENYGESTLDAVWTRWSAVKSRTFNQAFNGVFPDTAEHLYQRFVVEYTVHVMQQYQQKMNNSAKADQSKIWLDLKGDVNAPSLSPNGKNLAIVETNRSEAQKKVTLNIYKTEKNTKEEKEFNTKNKELLNADPLDIADNPPEVFKREKPYSLDQKNHRGIKNPRWLDNDTIIYGASSLANQNSFHQDLFSWHLPSNSVTQLTFNENLRRFDIVDDGSYLIAEQSRYGYSQLVKINLNQPFTSENIEPLTIKSLEKIYDFPRIRPKITSNDSAKTQYAYLESNLNKKWLLKIKTLGEEQEQIIPLPKEYQFLSFPEWSKDGRNLYYVAGVHGATQLYRYNFKQKRLIGLDINDQPITWPMAQNKDTLLHLAINSQGPDVYQVDLTKVNTQQIKQTTTSANITNKQALLAEELKLVDAKINIDESIGEEKSYNIGPQKGTITLTESYYSASNSMLELGYKSSDVLGRFDWQVNLSQDVLKNNISGSSATVQWQGWPVKLFTHAYQMKLKTDNQESQSLRLGKVKETGLFVEARYPYSHETLTFDSIAQLKYEQFDDLALNANLVANLENSTTNKTYSSKYLSLGFEQTWSLDKQSWGITQQLNAQYIVGDDEQAQLTNTIARNNNYHGNNGLLSLSGRIKQLTLGFSYRWAQRSNEAGDILSLGGYSSTLIQSKAHLNKLLSPELAFYRQKSNDYQGYQAFVPFKFGEVFYARHKMAKQAVIDSYGMKGKIKSDLGFTGLSNLEVNYGIAQVNPNEGNSETQGWLGFGYKW